MIILVWNVFLSAGFVRILRNVSSVWMDIFYMKMVVFLSVRLDIMKMGKANNVVNVYRIVISVVDHKQINVYNVIMGKLFFKINVLMIVKVLIT